MEQLEKKVIKGSTYYYYSKWERRDGRCRRVWQKYLGKLEDIVKAVEGVGLDPQHAEVFEFALSAALWRECCNATMIQEIDHFCQKRDQGMSVGEYITLAAINRAIQPVSKKSFFDWFSGTVLRRYFPDASRPALTSQRFWDHMDRIDPATAIEIWKATIGQTIRRESIDISSVCYDGTNFYTFIDTFNIRCDIASRGKNKQGRNNLRQVSYALFCSTDGQIPLYYDVYDGNRNDTKEFPIMIQEFSKFLKDIFNQDVECLNITLIFDKGSNSNDNFKLVDSLGLHYVGSIRLGEVKELAEISNRDESFGECETIGLEDVKAFRTNRTIYGKERVVVVSYNQDLFNAQWKTLYADIERTISELGKLQDKLRDRDKGLIKGGKCPTKESINKQCQGALTRPYIKDIIKYDISITERGIPSLSYEVDGDAIGRISDTYLGKNIVITDMKTWSNDDIILAYRSQFNIENVFREIKDRDIGSWWPLFHWTDQKIKIHALYCTLALLIRALAHQRIRRAGINISMKRMLSELDDIKEVIVVYPRKRGAKVSRKQTTLSKTTELQDSLVSVLRLTKDEMVKLG